MSLRRSIARISTVNTLLFREQRRRTTINQIDTCVFSRAMKRKAGDQRVQETSKRSRIKSSYDEKPKIDDYCYTSPTLDENEEEIWPAHCDQIKAARNFLQECASSQMPTLIVPDKDADGLCAGVIVHRTLIQLGLDPCHLDVHLVQKGSNIHEESERKTMKAKDPKFVIVLDQGSRGGPPVIDSDAKCLIIDHHMSDDFPKDAMVVSACHYPPIATTSLLAYEICKVLHPSIVSICDYLCAIGTHGDLGNALKWLKPFPDMTDTFKTYTKKAINHCASLINAPRRTDLYDVITAWKALLNNPSPKNILLDERLILARMKVTAEVEKQTHTPPIFSQDGKFAVLKIKSEYQVHPVIATRWAGFLKSDRLEIVMVANFGYLPGKVNFSCRIAKCAKNRDTPVNIIESLKAVANLDEGDLVSRLGDSFAKGHKEASGGVVNTAEFEEFCKLMKLGEKSNTAGSQKSASFKRKVVEKSPQKNNLGNYFAKV